MNLAWHNIPTRESNTRNQTLNTFLLLLNGWIVHDIIFPREWNTRNQTLNTFFLPQSNIGISFVFDFLCYENSVLPTCNLSCSIFPALSWAWRVLGKIYSFVLWMCLLSWTYLKHPLSAKVHSQSCCLNCMRRGVTQSPSWLECVTLCLDNTFVVPIFFKFLYEG
jgi:hypothetical protein